MEGGRLFCNSASECRLYEHYTQWVRIHLCLKGIKHHPCSFELDALIRGPFLFMFILYEQFLNPNITITDLRQKPSPNLLKNLCNLLQARFVFP